MSQLHSAWHALHPLHNAQPGCTGARTVVVYVDSSVVLTTPNKCAHGPQQRVQERLNDKAASPEALDRVLLYVLLWQFLKHGNVMLLVELALERSQAEPTGQGFTTAGRVRRTRRLRMPTAAAIASLSSARPHRSAHDSFLEEVGVPLTLKALEEVCAALACTACRHGPRAPQETLDQSHLNCVSAYSSLPLPLFLSWVA